MSENVSIQGVYTALVTPMDESGIQWSTLESLVEKQISAGIKGLVPVGTTGESPTLDPEEHLQVIEKVVKTARGRVPVIAGTGANATKEALHLTREADKIGADGFLQVAPYYNKPSQEGLYAHFSRVAEITDKPIILYSIPGRCGVEISIDVISRLSAAFPHVRTVKEASGRVERVADILAADPRINVLSGDDGLIAPFVSMGATGVISVASNLCPSHVLAYFDACISGDRQQAVEIYSSHKSLFTDLVFLDGNPVTIKEAMFAAGILPSPCVRLPLVRTSSGNQAYIRKMLDALNISSNLS